MKSIAFPIGLLALAGSIVPPVLFALHMMAESPMKMIMLISTFAWFITAPMWMKTE
jgi:hypothetical protein